MPSEFSPPGQGARMTKAQVRKYIRDMKKKRAAAIKKLKEYEASWELEQEKEELEELEKIIDDL